MEFIAGVVVGMVLVVLGVTYGMWRTRPDFDAEALELQQLEELIAEVTATIKALTADEWADEEARALEAAEQILREQQP